jgi:hypothetical protein
MTDTVPRTAVGRLIATRGLQAWLRVAVLLSPMVAFWGTSEASGAVSPVVAMLLLCLAAACALSPESNLGLLIVTVVGIHWLVAVEDVTSPWSLVVGLALGVLHLAMAAASVAPPAARWTRGMARRWAVRAGWSAGATAVVAIVVQLIGGRTLGGGSVVLIGALVWLVVAALWVRRTSLTRPVP